jgi:hypothetical protein
VRGLVAGTLARAWVVLLLGLASARATPAAPQPRSAQPRLAIDVTPARVVLGQGPQDATVNVTLPPASARAGLAGLRVETTAGRLAGLSALGGGRYRAKLEPPSDRFPQIAVVTVADVAGLGPDSPPDVRIDTVAYAARIDLKGETEKKARMVLDISGHRFGPVISDDGGRFVIPVVVEPGEGWATGIATDVLGNASRSRINLYLPAVQRLQAYVFPEVLVADGSMSRASVRRALLATPLCKRVQLAVKSRVASAWWPASRASAIALLPMRGAAATP